jgi:23S rRNA pseudouridine1911/1915/1917 synthase
MAHHTVKVETRHQGQRLDVFLTENLEAIPSRSFAKKLIDCGHVRVNERLLKPHHKVSARDDVMVEIPSDFQTQKYVAPEDISLDVFYEDDFFLIVNKPIGMTVHPASGCYSGTLVNALLNYSVHLSRVNEDVRPGIVHRLDKATSGLIIIAKDNITHTRLAKQFQQRKVKKTYVALVEGKVEFEEGRIEAPLGKHPRSFKKRKVLFDDSAKKALTYYKVIRRSSRETLVSFAPKTGRTHQIRVHAAYMRHPILGDDMYGHKSSYPRLALHSRSLGFHHPRLKTYMEFSTRIPQEFLDKVNYG